MPDKQKPVSVYFPPELLERLRAHADSLGPRQFNRVVNDACRDHMDNVEQSKGLSTAPLSTD
jgi:hypothetical protein